MLIQRIAVLYILIITLPFDVFVFGSGGLLLMAALSSLIIKLILLAIFILFSLIPLYVVLQAVPYVIKPSIKNAEKTAGMYTLLGLLTLIAFIYGLFNLINLIFYPASFPSQITGVMIIVVPILYWLSVVYIAYSANKFKKSALAGMATNPTEMVGQPESIRQSNQYAKS